MKKIIIFAVLLALFFLKTSSVSAADPDCDPSEVYISSSVPIVASQVGGSQPACDGLSKPSIAGYTVTGYKFCNPSVSLGTVASSSCWPLVQDSNNRPVTAISEKSIQLDVTRIPNICGRTPGCAYNNVTGFCETSGRVCPVQIPDCSGVLNPGFNFDISTDRCVLTIVPPQISLSQNFRVHLCTPEDGSCDTALGSIPLNPAALTARLLKLLVAISGVVIVFMSIIAGYNVITSSGDPQKLAATREMIVSLLGGIVLIVFSIVLLQAIGVDILGIPGLQEHLATTGIR